MPIHTENSLLDSFIVKMPRRNLSYNEKFKVLQAIQANQGVDQISSDFKVHRSTIFRIITNEGKIRKAIDKKRKKTKR